MANLDLKITTLPGEALLVAIFEFATKSRETMSQANRDRYDAANILILERWVAFWERIGAFGGTPPNTGGKV